MLSIKLNGREKLVAYLIPPSNQSAIKALDKQVPHLFFIIEHPISDHRTWSTLVKLYRQVADLFLIQNENIIVLLYSNASCMVSFGYFNME